MPSAFSAPSQASASSGDAKTLYKKLNRLLGNVTKDLPTNNDPIKLSEDFKNFFAEKVEKIREDIKDEASDLQLRVKVTDGEIVFPLSSVGNKVFVEGEFSKLIFSEDQAKQWKIHLAEEKGQILDPDSVIIKDSDLVEYRIIGKGAEIYPL